MTKKESIVRQNEMMELIYNLHSVCEALIYDSLGSAEALFEERLRRISALSGGRVPQVEGMIVVTSLNRCLYDFFQFYMHVSLTECCWRNRVQAEAMESDADIRRAGLSVLRDYHDSFSRKREACSHLEKARVYIREHLDEPLTLQRVSRAIHISGAYLSRIFSTLTGQTFCDYVREERIALSRKLLSGTSLSVDAIAARCGFNTPNYFATVFARYMGQSPSAYRKSERRQGQTQPFG